MIDYSLKASFRMHTIEQRPNLLSPSKLISPKVEGNEKKGEGGRGGYSRENSNACQEKRYLILYLTIRMILHLK